MLRLKTDHTLAFLHSDRSAELIANFDINALDHSLKRPLMITHCVSVSDGSRLHFA